MKSVRSRSAFLAFRADVATREYDRRVRAESALANDILTKNPDVRRSEALRVAARMLNREAARFGA